MPTNLILLIEIAIYTLNLLDTFREKLFKAQYYKSTSKIPQIHYEKLKEFRTLLKPQDFASFQAI